MMSIFHLSSIFKILAVIGLLNACSANPPPVSKGPHPKMILAEKYFEMGSWQKLKEVIPDLPTDDPNEKKKIDFYFFFIDGLSKNPDKSFQQFEKWANELPFGQIERDVYEFYMYLFKARVSKSNCLTSMGPLEKIYQPRLKDLGVPESVRKILKKTMTQCESATPFKLYVDDLAPKPVLEAEPVTQPSAETTVDPLSVPKIETQPKALDLPTTTTPTITEPTPTPTIEPTPTPTPTIEPTPTPTPTIEPTPTPTPTIEPTPTPTTEPTPTPTTEPTPTPTTDPQTPTMPPIFRPVGQINMDLFAKLESHIAIFLPLQDAKLKNTAKMLEMTAHYLQTERNQLGVNFKISIFDNSDRTQIDALINQLTPDIKAIVGLGSDEFSKALMNKVSKENDALYGRPFFLITSSSSALNAPTQVWRLFTSLDIITKSVVQLASKVNAKRVGAIYMQGSENSLETLKNQWVKTENGEWIDSVMIPKEKPDYPSLAKHIANWEVDSLFFVSLDAQKVAELSSYLANVDIWSEKAKGAKGKKLKYFLWPTAYHPKLLIQGSRYLEGALLVNPVQTQMPNLVFFEKNASQALNRNLNLYDHFFVELVDQIDHHIRMSQIQGIPLKESLKKNRIEARFLKSVSYDTPDILKELQEITIDQGEFKGYPIEETTQPPTPSEPPPEN